MGIIEIAGVHKSFLIPGVRRTTVREQVLQGWRRRPVRERLEVLRGVDLEVRPGETLGVMGRNGAGKSTLLKVLCGIYTPDRGHVRLRGPVTPILELGVGWNPE